MAAALLIGGFAGAFPASVVGLHVQTPALKTAVLGDASPFGCVAEQLADMIRAIGKRDDGVLK